jgi:hypothetical protein
MATAPSLHAVVGAALYAVNRVASLKEKQDTLAWEKLPLKTQDLYTAASKWLGQQPPGCLLDRDALAMRMHDAQKGKDGKPPPYNARLAVEVWMSAKMAFRAG